MMVSLNCEYSVKDSLTMKTVLGSPLTHCFKMYPSRCNSFYKNTSVKTKPYSTLTTSYDVTFTSARGQCCIMSDRLLSYLCYSASLSALSLLGLSSYDTCDYVMVILLYYFIETNGINYHGEVV